jgi:SnoaL-like domain
MENDESRRLQVLKEVAHAFNRHDLDTVMSYFAEDAVLVGQVAVREGLASRFAMIPDVQYGDDRHWVCGNLGVSEWLLTGTTTAGARLAVRGCDHWEFRGDRIVRKDSYWKIVE